MRLLGMFQQSQRPYERGHLRVGPSSGSHAAGKTAQIWYRGACFSKEGELREEKKKERNLVLDEVNKVICAEVVEYSVCSSNGCLKIRFRLPEGIELERKIKKTKQTLIQPTYFLEHPKDCLMYGYSTQWLSILWVIHGQHKDIIVENILSFEDM